MTNDTEAKKRLEIKQLVKIRRNGERFWCEITGQHDDGSYQATINNHVMMQPESFGDEIRITEDEVIDVYGE